MSANTGHGTLTVSDINHLIEQLVGNDTPLQAVDRDDTVYLVHATGGATEYVRLDAIDRTREEMPRVLYEYAVHFGYTCDDFSDWMGS